MDTPLTLAAISEAGRRERTGQRVFWLLFILICLFAPSLGTDVAAWFQDSSGTRRSVQTDSDADLKRICSLDTSMHSARLRGS